MKPLTSPKVASVVDMPRTILWLAIAYAGLAMAERVEIPRILSETEPIGGFVGICVSDPLMRGGDLNRCRVITAVTMRWLAKDGGVD